MITSEAIKRYISQIEIDEMITDLYVKIRKSGISVSSIVGIERGGLHVSKPLADLMCIPHYTIKISFYKGDKIGTEPIVDLHRLPYDLGKNKFLLVDDLLDTGTTLRYFEKITDYKQSNDFYFASLHCKDKTQQRPDFFSELVASDVWLIYPWEKSEND